MKRIDVPCPALLNSDAILAYLHTLDLEGFKIGFAELDAWHKLGPRCFNVRHLKLKNILSLIGDDFLRHTLPDCFVNLETLELWDYEPFSPAVVFLVVDNLREGSPPGFRSAEVALSHTSRGFDDVNFEVARDRLRDLAAADPRFRVSAERDTDFIVFPSGIGLPRKLYKFCVSFTPSSPSSG